MKRILLIALVCLISVTSNAKDDHQKDSHHERKVGEVSSLNALKKLKEGNDRFYNVKVRTDGISPTQRDKLSKGQQPYAIILSCSDSRVPPEIIFDQKLGEIFVIRVAGESLDSSVIGSIEYAVAHLGSNLIVVMGHDSCGAVKAALDTLKGGDAGSSALNKLVADIHPRLERFKNLSRTDDVVVESWVNVEGVAKDLLERSKIVHEAVESGTLKIERALYHLASGKVEWR